LALQTDDRPIGLLIADECHMGAGILASQLSAWFSNSDLHKHAAITSRDAMERAHGAEHGMVDDGWLVVLAVLNQSCVKRMGEIEEWFAGVAAQAYRQSKEYRKLSKLKSDSDRILELGGDKNWLWRMTKSGISFDCVWPGRYAERWLWTGVPRIALMSATLRPKALAMLGLSESKYWFKEFPRVFPAENNPVVWIPTGRMGVKADEAELRKTIIRSDEIYDEWAPGYKGIVHTASYRRAEWLQSNSRWGRHMLLNKAGQAVDMAERFRKSKPPCILVSPSYTTGWDFPDQDCEWQHIIKLPFPDLSDPIVSARRESDQDWMDYETMQTLVQASGRGTRHYTDKCVVMITDDAVGKFRNYARRHSPTWFSISESKTVPKAPK
jgi:Rad3-related DNA helicase